MVVLINKIAGIGAIITYLVIIYLVIVIEKNRKLHLNDEQESVEDSAVISKEEAIKFEKKRKHLKLLMVASVLSIILSIINIWVR